MGRKSLDRFARGLVLLGMVLAAVSLLDQARCWASPDQCVYSKPCTANGYNVPGFWCNVGGFRPSVSAGTGAPGTKKYLDTGSLCGDEIIITTGALTTLGCGDSVVVFSVPPC